MRQLLIVDGDLPTMNEWAGKKTHWHYGKLKKDAEAIIWAAIKQQRIQPMSYAYFSFIWFATHRRKNPDNLASATKFILDALVSAKILPNDGWDNVLGLKHQFVRSEKSAVHISLTDKLEG